MKELTILFIIMLPFVGLFFGIKAKERGKVKGWSVLTILATSVTAALVTIFFKEAHWVSYILLIGLGAGGFVPGFYFTERPQ